MQMKHFQKDDDLRLNESAFKCYASNFNPSKEYLKQCDCPLECQLDGYTLSLSSGEHLSKETRIEIFYDEMKEEVISEVIKIELTDLISSLGGILGLFTGFSFLSLVEIVEIFLQIAFILFKRSDRVVSE